MIVRSVREIKNTIRRRSKRGTTRTAEGEGERKAAPDSRLEPSHFQSGLIKFISLIAGCRWVSISMRFSSSSFAVSPSLRDREVPRSNLRLVSPPAFYL